MHRILIVCLLLLAPQALRASGQSIPIPKDAKFLVQVDVASFQKTELGQKLIALTEKMASEEIGKDGEDVLQKVQEALGFDPLNEIQTVLIASNSYENPEEGVCGIVQLGKTTGNLEGMMLAMPGYDSSEKGDYTIHHFREDDMEGHVAIHTDRSGDKWLAAATSEKQLGNLLDSLNGNSDSDTKRIELGLPSSKFLQVTCIELPLEEFDDDPPANIIKYLDDLSVSLSENDDKFVLEVALTTTDEKKTKQIAQLAQGLVAMSSLLASELDENEADIAIQAAQAVDLNVDQDARRLTIRAAVPSDLVLEFLREEADLPL